MAWMTQKVKKNDTCWIKQVNMAGRCLQIYARNIKFWSNFNLVIQSNIKLNRYVAFVGTGGGGAGLGDIVGLTWPKKIWKFWAGNWKFCESLCFGNNLYQLDNVQSECNLLSEAPQSNRLSRLVAVQASSRLVWAFWFLCFEMWLKH